MRINILPTNVLAMASLCLTLALATTTAAHPSAVEKLYAPETEKTSSKSVIGTLEKDAEVDATLCVGDVIRYIVTLTNLSPETLDAAICDPIPEGTTYVDGSASEDAGPVETDTGLCIRWPNDEQTAALAPGESYALSFSVTVNDPDASTIVNRATGWLDGSSGVVEYPLEIECPPAITECAIQVSGRVEDSAGNGTDRYPISNARVRLFNIDAEPLPIDPLSQAARTPTDETRTNHTTEANFNGIDFKRPHEATYSFDLAVPLAQEDETCPPRVIVTSFLWDAEDTSEDQRCNSESGSCFVVSSSNSIDGILIPLYLASCISNDPNDLPPNGPCRPWQEAGPDLWSAEDVDFTFGISPTSRESAQVIGDPANPESSEEWNPGSASQDQLQRNGAHIYFYSYKAIEYLKDLAKELGISLGPAEVVTHVSDGTGAYPSPADEFGLPGESEPAVAAVDIDDSDSVPDSGDKPDNREWHELGHYWMMTLYGGDWPEQPDEDNNSVNHGGYANDTTWDSYIEGFAEFTSMLIAEHYGDSHPFYYRWEGSLSNLELDYRVWGSYLAVRGPTGNLTGFRSLTPDDEEFAVAGVLWDFYDGGDLTYDNISEEKALGVVSSLIKVQDWLSLDVVDIFDLIHRQQPSTLKQLHSRFKEAHPLNYDAPDDFGDVDEILIAHGAFNDIKNRNLLHDTGEEPGLTGNSSPPDPERLKRESKPPIPNAFLRLHFIDSEGNVVSPQDVVLKVRIEVDAPFEYYSYDYDMEPQSNRIYLAMPPNYFPSQAVLTAVDKDGLGSAPYVLRSEDYWAVIDSDAEVVAEHTFHLRESDDECFSGNSRLCLNQGRFKVEVDWKDFQGNAGHGQVADLISADSGLFYFFDADNWEMLVKVLDGCGFNDHFWVFSAATTNVEYTLRVTDTETGATSEYFNPLGQAAPAITDTAAFATCSDGAAANARWVNLASALGDGDLVTGPAASGDLKDVAAAKQAPCVDSSDRLCLDGGRFRVEADWKDFQGNAGSAQLVPFRAEDSGVFWFFDPDNWEMLVKVLDGCGFNDRFWVFSAATTNVEYTLRVTDTEAGVTREYFNPLGQAADALTDTDAFATCP